MTAEPPATARTPVDLLDRHVVGPLGTAEEAGTGTQRDDADRRPVPEARHPATDEFSGAMRRARRIGWVLIGLQLVAMLAFSTVQYHRFALTSDFGAYSQAWWKIAHGQLNPWSSVFATPFWKNDAEFALWPLSQLFWVYPHAAVLLWIQDLAVAATELVTLAWVIDVLDGSRERLSTASCVVLAVGAAAVMVADPWAYQTIGFDVH
ncbi:MAG TPA: hypothetical protein VED63_06690, partial [Acidimicrobiales bacterium]|nr:hypothetical protein [Acidimicrobiales bacterium]